MLSYEYKPKGAFAMPYIIDTHCDTLSLLDKYDFLSGSEEMNVSLPRLIRGNVRMQCFAVCVHPWESVPPAAAGRKMIDTFHRLVKNTDSLIQIKQYSDIELALASGRTGAMLTLEGADMLENDSSAISSLYEDGVRMFTFAWNNSNFLCGGIGENNSGLTPDGFFMLSECERLGIVVDVSHLSEESFFDIAGRASVPFIASHSNARRVCGNKRNLSDEQLIAIRNAGGCVGINLYPPFLNDSGKADITDVLKHIEYISGFIGAEYVSIGCDFDGTENDLPRGLEHPGKLQKLASRLAGLNYTDDEINGIFHGNVSRVLKAVI